MTYILHIETATQIGSVCLSKDGIPLITKESEEEKTHATKLTLFIEELIKKAHISMADLSAISISEGPGSYTGLRIGVSTAKGIAYGLSIPLIAIPTLKAMAYGALNATDRFDYIAPMIDARRMEVYTALFDKNLNTLQDTYAKIIDDTSFLDLLETKKILFLGTGADKCKDTITHKNAFFTEDNYVSASYMASLSYQKYQEKDFVDTAYFEPFYLKEFRAIPSKKTFF